MKRLIKTLVRRFGYDLVPYHIDPLQRSTQLPVQGKESRLLKLLTYFEVDLVLDVGANAGQFALDLWKGGYDGKIISFEPLSSAHQRLSQAAQTYPNWTVHPRCAIGDARREVVIHVAQNSESSSLLPMLPAHQEAAPRSQYVATETVSLFPLPDVAGEAIAGANNPFLKMDVQGFEAQVLQGAQPLLPQIQGLQLEMSLVPLYESEMLFEEMLGKLKDLGFAIYGLSTGFWDYRTGRVLQVNGIFFRDQSG